MRQGKKGSLEECSRSKKKIREDYQKSLATTALLEDLFIGIIDTVTRCVL